MTLRDDLLSVLDLGWKTSREVWRLLTSGQDATAYPEATASMGRDMDQLAYDLRRLGHDKPARLAFSVAFVLNMLGGQTIQFDRDLADKTSQIVSILAEMLLELEATSQILTQEPIEIVEHLKSCCGLVTFAENHPEATLPHPHFAQPTGEAEPSADDELSDLVAISEELVWASESLLNRVTQQGGFPYFASLGRIHHLGTTIRDRVVALPTSQQLASPVSISHPCIPHPETEGPEFGGKPLRQSAGNDLPVGQISNPSGVDGRIGNPSYVIGSWFPADCLKSASTLNSATAAPATVSSASDPIVAADVVDPMPLTTDCAVHPIDGERSADGTPKVLIIDESPFFRMLLTSAIEAAGYRVRSVPGLAEAQEVCAAENWDLVLCSGNALTAAAGSWNWLRDRSTAWNANVIGLSTGQAESAGQAEFLPESFLQISRTNIAVLLNVVKTTLGPASRTLRISA